MQVATVVKIVHEHLSGPSVTSWLSGGNGHATDVTLTATTAREQLSPYPDSTVDSR
jgi:hypothetical protein